MSGKSILVVGESRLGDAVMSLPALQLFRREYPDAEVVVLAAADLQEFWALCPTIDRVLSREKFGSSLWRSKQERFERAYLLSASLGSAFLVYRAGIPQRIGAHAHWMHRILLTDTVQLGTGHQQFNAMSILGVQGDPLPPEVRVPLESVRSLERKLVHHPALGENRAVLFQALATCALAGGRESPAGGRPVVTMLPRTVRDSSKGWPITHFKRLAQTLCSTLHAVVLLGGGAEDVAVCEEIAAGEADVMSLAGQTTFAEWAALLQASHVVVGNAGGGVHLASAVGTAVVGLDARGDPQKTLPLGPHTVLLGRDAKGGNADASAADAARSLAQISASEVSIAVKNLLTD